MNPEQAQHNQITLTNLAAEPFDCIYNSASYGLLVKGQTRTFPQSMANIFLKHLVDSIMNERNESTADLGKRSAYTQQIVLNITAAVQEAPKTENQLLEDKISQMNRPSDLDLYIAKQTQPIVAPIAIVPTPPPVPVQPEPVVTVPDLSAALADVALEQKQIETNTPQAPEQPQTELRGKLVAYAQDTLMINVEDPKTKAAWAVMDDETLSQELNYEEPI